VTMRNPPPIPSTRLLQACALFGIAPLAGDDHEQRCAHARAAARSLLRLGAGQIAFITGPSGAGKSLILRQLAELARPRTPILAINIGPARWRRGCVIDQFPGTLAHALAALARTGLADATILAQDPRTLSEGQRFRLRLAIATQRAMTNGGAAPPPASGARKARMTPAPSTPSSHTPLLLVDELATALDRITARAIARTLRRWVACTGGRAICASAGDDILEALAPDVLVYQPLSAPPMIVARRETHT
jgi:ABC-type glutathione transport system ATPase component